VGKGLVAEYAHFVVTWVCAQDLCLDVGVMIVNRPGFHGVLAGLEWTKQSHPTTCTCRRHEPWLQRDDWHSDLSSIRAAANRVFFRCSLRGSGLTHERWTGCGDDYRAQYTRNSDRVVVQDGYSSIIRKRRVNIGMWLIYIALHWTVL
jgi:hypothetical protein